MHKLQSGGTTLNVDGTEVSLTIDDVLVETEHQAGYAAESDRGVSVALKTELTPELIEEGFVRELISKLQTMRKEAGYEVLDRIDVSHTGNENIETIFDNNSREIKAQVLADNISGCPDPLPGSYSKEWDINGEKVMISVKKIC
jgi:isoleucyl-tRNA synthetase